MSSTGNLVSAPLGWVAVAAIAFLIAATVWLPGAVHASEEDGVSPAQSTVSDEGHDDAASDPEANLPFLFAVYIITWAGFFGYAFVMSRRQREMQRELDALSAIVTEKETESRPS